MSKKSPKFLNNKIQLTPQEDLELLIAEIQKLRNVVSGRSIGQIDHIFFDAFRFIRPLVKSNGWASNPLLQRVMDRHNYSLQFFVATPLQSKNVLSASDGVGLWRPILSSSHNTRTDFNNYLELKIHFNPFEDRWITSNDLIGRISDKSIHHYDEELDKFVNSLGPRNLPESFQSISSREKFFWDIYWLIEWHFQRLMLTIDFRKNRDSMPSPRNAIEQYSQQARKINFEFNNFFSNSPVIQFSLNGQRTCDCKTKGALLKINDTQFKCRVCNKIHQL